MDSDNNYKAEDFLSGKIPKEGDGRISDSEKELARDIKSVIKSAGNEKIPSLEAAELWARIQDSKTSKSKSYNWKLFIQIAAVLLLVLGAGLWNYQRHTSTNRLLTFAAQNINNKIISKMDIAGKPINSTPASSNDEENIITTNDFNTLVVGNDQRSVIHLPDGTKVWLNSGSKLIYPTSFAKDSREVYLEGEAYFDVAHNKEWPFYVRAKNMNIKVLGTEFYVSSNLNSNSNYAVLVRGSIVFSTGSWLSKAERKLVPGEQISYDLVANKLLISQVKTDDIQSWKEGYIDVNSESLKIIIQRIAKYYNIEINTEGLDLSETFSGKLMFQRNAGDVLNNILFDGTSFVYDSTERRIRLKKN
ncbi:FecR family protein [Pedobacter sp. V48]|uniref:FecR family protein n=1 Tax=Pedobacter sp. V48 TaxID=509635 RepID=UPI0003E56964|nr:FecR domain-containing protein [Pedobacter sp. V48]ETZ21505.1 hypothetical protein N824_28090 [Pedobacter sp. V48]